MADERIEELAKVRVGAGGIGRRREEGLGAIELAGLARPAGGMALGAIVEFEDALVAVDEAHLVGLMVVAAVAGVGEIVFGVTGLASELALIAVVEEEGVAGEKGGLPGGEAVAAGALEAKAVGVDDGLLVAGGAFVGVAGRDGIAEEGGLD